MENVDREDAKALLQWCEERSDRAVPSTIPSSARAKPAPAAGEASSVPSKSIEERSLRDGIENFPMEGDLSDLGDLFSELGELLDVQGDAIGAEKVFREGTRRAPGMASCISSLGYKLVQRHDLQGAERVLREGIKNFPKDGDLADLDALLSNLQWCEKRSQKPK